MLPGTPTARIFPIRGLTSEEEEGEETMRALPTFENLRILLIGIFAYECMSMEMEVEKRRNQGKHTIGA